MGKEVINMFTYEEIEILKSVLLERSTFYTKKIVNDRKLQLNSSDDSFVKGLNSEIDYNYKLKNVVDKFYKILLQNKGE